MTVGGNEREEDGGRLVDRRRTVGQDGWEDDGGRQVDGRRMLGGW